MSIMMTRRLSWPLAAGISLVGLLLAIPVAHARNLLTADGPGGTYERIRTAYTTELPDCGHMVDHITEVFDDELKKNVFVFHAHVNQDDDRCGATDRQRTEIRARASDIVANNGETVYYRWKFKLPNGFQTSPNFTHIMQIKSDEAAPVMTLTPRNSTMSIDGRIGARGTTELEKFIGVWVVVDLKVLYGNSGRVEMTIRKVAGGDMLFSYAGAADTWDDGASAHDSKFGIYRSLNNRGSLRDEQVRFADFCASKVNASECDDGTAPPPPPRDAGGGGLDAGGGGQDAGARPDAATTVPDAAKADSTLAPPPDAARDSYGAPIPPLDARPPPVEPPPTTNPPTDPPDPVTPRPRPASGGCSVRPASATPAGWAAVIGLVACALGLRRRRR